MNWGKGIKYKEVLQNLSVAILVENSQRKIEFVNQAFLDLFGLNQNSFQIIGVNCDDLALNAAVLFQYPLEFQMRINQLIFQKEIIKGEELTLSDGRVLLRDFLPVVEDSQLTSIIWQYQLK